MHVDGRRARKVSRIGDAIANHLSARRPGAGEIDRVRRRARNVKRCGAGHGGDIGGMDHERLAARELNGFEARDAAAGEDKRQVERARACWQHPGVEAAIAA